MLVHKGQAALAMKVVDRQTIDDLAHSGGNLRRLWFDSLKHASSKGSSMVGVHINVLGS